MGLYWENDIYESIHLKAKTESKIKIKNRCIIYLILIITTNEIKTNGSQSLHWSEDLAIPS